MNVMDYPKFYSKSVFLEAMPCSSVLREQLISLFDGGVLYFNPEEYKTEDELKNEITCRRSARWNVFLITDEMLDDFSSVKFLEDIYCPHKKVIFGIFGKSKESHIEKLEEIKKKLLINDCFIFGTLKEVADKLNSSY